MLRQVTPLLALFALGLSAPVLASTSDGFRDSGTSRSAELPPYLQCVPYARDVSGVQIFGDAHTWWDQAEGRYERGKTPQVGAVMSFPSQGKMRLGHVAAVSKVIDSRTVLLDHANWSPINGRRGQIERDVKAIDVSPNNDWSQVRVWYDPIKGLGKTPWPVNGFIYPKSSKAKSRSRIARAVPEQVTPRAQRRAASPAFASAFASLDTPARVASPRAAVAPRASYTPRKATPLAPIRSAARASYSARKASPLAPIPARKASSRKKQSSDPLDAVLARYED